ncbi:chaperone modulator CbpM [Chloroflexota bacterium]
MSRRKLGNAIIATEMAVRLTGLSRYEILRCAGRGLVRQPLTAADLAELRRVRRMQELGVNLAGIEIILRMRRRIVQLEAELARRRTGRQSPAWTGDNDRWRRLLTWEPDGEEVS